MTFYLYLYNKLMKNTFSRFNYYIHILIMLILLYLALATYKNSFFNFIKPIHENTLNYFIFV